LWDVLIEPLSPNLASLGLKALNALFALNLVTSAIVPHLAPIYALTAAVKFSSLGKYWL